MIDDPAYKQLLEQSWQRKLTPEEEQSLRAWLAAHPDAQANWNQEAGLNEALAGLPDAPVPSNFTARVLQAIERDHAAEARPAATGSFFWARLRWLPRLAFVAVVLCAGLISYQQVQAHNNRERMRAMVTVVSSLPSPEVLKDFNAIQALNQTPPDEELLTALK